MFADGARMFGLFPRATNPQMEGEEEEVQVMESEGVEPLLTLRTIESVFFHHPRASVTFVRSSIRSSWAGLEDELETLQESGYNLEVVEEVPTPRMFTWTIHSPTILLKPMPSAKNAKLKEGLREGLSSEDIKIIPEKSDFCKEENSDKIQNLTAISINLNLTDISKNTTSTSLCHHILNSFCILANIII